MFKQFKIIQILILTIIAFNANSQNHNSDFKYSSLESFKIVATNGCIDSLFFATDSIKLTNQKHQIDTIYNRIETLIDSLNFEIVHYKYLDGKRIISSIKNNSTDIAYWNEFDEQGLLKGLGYSLGYLIPIGQWETYTSKGDLTGIIDHENDRKITFCDFFKILQDLNLEGDEIGYQYKSEEDEWWIINWTRDLKYIIDIHGSIQIAKMNY